MMTLILICINDCIQLLQSLIISRLDTIQNINTMIISLEFIVQKVALIYYNELLFLAWLILKLWLSFKCGAFHC